jgi:hypothetical protein
VKPVWRNTLAVVVGVVADSVVMALIKVSGSVAACLQLLGVIEPRRGISSVACGRWCELGWSGEWRPGSSQPAAGSKYFHELD